MPISNITARDIIINAVREIGAYDFGETMPDDEILSGLFRLNSLLDSFEGETYCIPYYTTVSMTIKAGKGSYTVGTDGSLDIQARKIIQIHGAKILYASTWQPLRHLDKSYYDDSIIMTQYKARPELIFLQNSTYNSLITFYPIPNIDYLCEIECKQALDPLELDDRLDEVPPSMVDYLIYELARRIAPSYSTSLTIEQQSLLEEAKTKVKRMANKSPLSLSVSRGSSIAPYQRGERGY